MLLVLIQLRLIRLTIATVLIECSHDFCSYDTGNLKLSNASPCSMKFLYVLNGRPKRMTGRPLKAIFYLNLPLISKTLLTNTTNTDFGREICMNFTSNIYLLECFYFIYNKTGR